MRSLTLTRTPLTLSKGGWSPAALFADGVAGDYWEASAIVSAVDATVQTVPGRRGRHAFAQATAGSRATLRQRADGVRYLDFSGSKSAAVSASTSLFNYLHDGTGGSWWAVVEWPPTGSTGYLFRSANSTNQNGLQLSKAASGQSLTTYICRGTSGIFAAQYNEARMPVGNGRLTVLIGSYKNDGSAGDLETSVDQAIDIGAAVTANAPASGNAGQSLAIDATFGGALYAWGVIGRKITTTERRRLAAYLEAAAAYQIAAPAYTIACGGQSNIDGRGIIDPTIPVPMEGVSIYDKSGRFRRCSEPSHSIINRSVATTPDEPSPSSPAISPVLTAGRALAVRGIPTLWVPSAVGGTTILQWDTPLTAGDPTTLFGALITRFKAALAAKGGSPVLVWSGHEGSASLAVPDYSNGGVGTDYQTAFSGLIANIRAAMGLGDIPLIIAQLAARDSLANAVTHAAAAEAQRQCELTIPNCVMIVQHDVERNAGSDDIHISRTGQYVVGARLDRAIAQHVAGLPVNGKGPRIASISRAGAVITITCNTAITASAGNYGSLFRAYAAGVEQTVSSAVRNADPTKIDITLSAVPPGGVTLTYGYRAGAASAARTDFVADADGLPLPLFGPLPVPAP